MRVLRRRHAPRRRLPPMSAVPTLLTLGNLIAGFAAIHFAARPPGAPGLPWEWTGLTFAGVLIFTGLLFDGMDGSVARLTRSSSSLGAQLDSLADMITFGVAPAFMAVRLVIYNLERVGEGEWLIGPEADGVLGKIVWGVAAAYVCSAALRLARFNVESGLTGLNERLLFRGLPSPGAAGAVASLVLLHQHLLVPKSPLPDVPIGLVQWSTLIVPLVMLLCAIGMVSSIPYVHLGNRYLRRPKSFAYIARIVIVLALSVWWLQETFAVAFTLYAMSGPAGLGWKRLRRRFRRASG